MPHVEVDIPSQHGEFLAALAVVLAPWQFARPTLAVIQGMAASTENRLYSPAYRRYLATTTQEERDALALQAVGDFLLIAIDLIWALAPFGPPVKPARIARLNQIVALLKGRWQRALAWTFRRWGIPRSVELLVIRNLAKRPRAIRYAVTAALMYLDLWLNRMIRHARYAGIVRFVENFVLRPHFYALLATYQEGAVLELLLLINRLGEAYGLPPFEDLERELRERLEELPEVPEVPSP